MNQTSSAHSAGPASLDGLGVAEDPLIGVDPASLLRTIAAAGAALVRNPMAVAAANARLVIGSAAAARATVQRALTGNAPGPVSPAAGTTNGSAT